MRRRNPSDPQTIMETISERPRVLRIDVGALMRGETVAARPWTSSVPWLERVGTWSGGALGLACLFEHALRSTRDEAPLVISVGDNVRRGVPTAARASVASRAPLTGLFAEGLVGGELARRLARLTDVLVLEGRTATAGAVLVLDVDGARVVVDPRLVGLSSRATHACLVETFGPSATLSIGPAGERELPLASLASGGEPPHFVGRGGLGAVLGRIGLKALVVTAAPVESSSDAALTSELLRSPRLLSRAEGGTLELFDAFRARGELRARGGEIDVDAATTAELAQDVASARATRHGCQGCPTPCGWTFDTRAGARQGARFGASYALGFQLELARFDDALELLRDCDEFGLDAKEVGACLGLLARGVRSGDLASGPRFGDLESMRSALRELVDGVGVGARMRGGAVRLAAELGFELTAAKGASVRADASLASSFGQCVSSRGGDPMRTFPFLAVDGADVGAMRASTGIDVADEAADPLSPSGKGRLVAWHEDWANALDMSGFCAFSAASLLSDGVLGIDELTRALAPRTLRGSGFGWLDAGATLSTMQRKLNEMWGLAADADRPTWARAQFDRPGLWDEYASVRGLDEHGRVTAERWTAVTTFRPWRVVAAAHSPREGELDVPARRPGRITVRGAGLGERTLHLELPCTSALVLETLGELAPQWPGRSAAIFRRGLRVGPATLIFERDELDFVAVVSGG